MKKVILYIATSADGFIADVNGGVDWLPQPQDDQDLDLCGYHALMNRIDTIVMGSKSYKQIVTFGPWAWQNKHTYVFSSEDLKPVDSSIEITHETPRIFMNRIQSCSPEKDIWLLGGAKLAQSFAHENLIDEIIVTIVPQVLKTGIPLGLTFEYFTLQSEKPLMDGMIQKTYIK